MLCANDAFLPQSNNVFAIVDILLQLTQYKTNHTIPLTLQKKTHEHWITQAEMKIKTITFSAM